MKKLKKCLFRFFQSQFVTSNLLESFQKVTEKSSMIVTIQPRSIINVYLRRSTKIVQDSSSLCLLNFCRKNSSNLDAAIKSFFACISQIKSSSIPMSRFTSQLLHKYLHSSVMIFVYKVFFRLHLIANL